jgi:RNA polymerase sigma-70 factor (ECF subfamily)
MHDALRGKLIDLIPELRGRARHLMRDRADGDDLLNTTLEKALRSLHSYQPTGTFRSWLMRIMRNGFIDELRRRKAHPSADVDGDGDGNVIDPRSIAENQLDRVHLHEVAREIEKLPAAQRQVLARLAFEGASYEDAAAEFGVAIGTIRSRLFRARETIRNRLG